MSAGPQPTSEGLSALPEAGPSSFPTYDGNSGANVAISFIRSHKRAMAPGSEQPPRIGVIVATAAGAAATRKWYRALGDLDLMIWDRLHYKFTHIEDNSSADKRHGPRPPPARQGLVHTPHHLAFFAVLPLPLSVALRLSGWMRSQSCRNRRRKRKRNRKRNRWRNPTCSLPAVNERYHCYSFARPFICMR